MAKLVSHENNKAVFTQVLSYEDFKANLQEAYNKNKSRFNIPGFRKGKAPRSIIERNYGKDVFWNDALDIALPDLYESAIEELEIQPVSRPKVDVLDEIEEGKDIEVTFEVETFPEIELGDYSNIEVEKLEEEVSEEAINARIDQEIQKNKVLNPVQRPVEEGDIVNIDFEGFKDDVAFEGGKAEGYDLKIGSGQFIPGFEDGLIGKETGEEVDLNITFPEDYQAEDLAGQDVVFKVKINKVVEEVLPELDDDFVLDVSEYDTVDEYKASIKEELKANLDKNNDVVLENAVLEEVLRRTPFELPEQMIEDQLHDEYHEYEHQVSHMGIDMKTYFEMTGQTKETVMDSLRDKAADKVRVEVILDKLVEDKEYEVSDDEIDQEYETVMKEYNKEGDEDFKNMLKAQIDEERVRHILQRRKALDELKSNVVFVDKKEEEKTESEEE